MIKLVLFDLDGTLANTLCDLADSCNYALEQFGFPTHETEKYKYFVGDGMPKLVERIIPKDKYTDEVHKECLSVFKKRYREHYLDKTVLYRGIKELISKLKQMGLKVGVISNKAHEMTLELVDKLLGAELFDIVYGKVEGLPAKPDPAVTLKAIEELGCEPSETVFIGDSGMDAKNAVNANCIGIGVLWGFRGKSELEENGARFTVSKPEEILKILEEI